MNARQASGHSFEKSSMSMSPKVVSRTTLPDVGGSNEYTPDISFFYSRAGFLNTSSFRCTKARARVVRARMRAEILTGITKWNQKTNAFLAPHKRETSLCVHAGSATTTSTRKKKKKKRYPAFILCPREHSHRRAGFERSVKRVNARP